ncbi:hypothetical protein SAMN05421544_1104 [Riemerella columbipharyngis]|uniref:Uncharacterized protein n=1 Tax=Riemerella columbipharyngis TaxID=1071918 RepID=A0A1G7D3P3_9FLAO|nr:hypothetical protein SAMN05421544_1104 [Riemerella columbipharyngis]
MFLRGFFFGYFVLQNWIFRFADYTYDDVERINKWIFSEILDDENRIGHLSSRGSNDFQGQSSVNINRYIVKLSDRSNRRYRSTLNIDKQNLIKVIIYFSARHCIAADWLNDRDQFLYPNDGWKTDKEFQSDCLAFTIFHSQNRISSQEGINHWIPFTEQEVDAKERFESHFMTDFLKGKLGNKKEENQLFTSSSDEQPTCLIPEAPISFSAEAQAVFDAGKELWKYYHTQTDANPNASLYDIRAHFQGRNDKGKMNAKSDDAAYTGLMNNLKENLKNLAEKITPKVYAYGFLRE